MTTFEELMNTIRENAANPIEPTTLDELSTTYQEELSIRDAAVAERDTRLADAIAAQTERDNEIRRLKAINYDLMVSVPKAGEETPVDKNNDNDGDRPRGIKALFE